MGKNNHIDELFRGQLEEFNPEPPVDMWERIESQLPSGKKHVYLPVYYRIAASIIILLGLSFFFGDTYFQDDANISLAQTEIKKQENNAIENESKVDTIQLNKRGLNKTLIQSGTSETHKKEAYSLLAEENPIEKNNEKPHRYSLINKLPAINAISIATDKFSDNSLLLKERATDIIGLPQEIAYLIPSEDKTPEPEKGNGIRFEFGASFQPSYSFRYYGADHITNMGTNYEGLESGLFRYSGGLSLSAHLSKRISLETGLQYLRQGQKLNNIYVFNSSYLQEEPTGFSISDKYVNQYQIQTSMGTINTENTSLYFTDSYNMRIQASEDNMLMGVPRSFQSLDAFIVQNLDYFQVPLQIRALIIDKSLDISITGGLSALILSNNSASLDINGSRHYLGETAGIKHINFGANAGLGFAYELSPGIYFQLEPRFSCYLNPIKTTKSFGYQTFPYTFTIGAGLKYNL